MSRGLRAWLLAALTLAPLVPAGFAQAEPLQPWSEFVVSPDVGTTGTPFVVSLAGSFAPVGAIATLAWGDGTVVVGTRTAAGFAWEASGGTASSPPSHRYARAGHYALTLTIDADGTASTSRAFATVTHDPAIVGTAEAESRLPALVAGPNDVVDPIANLSVGARIVSLVGGFDPGALPPALLAGIPYETCSPLACKSAPLAEATDPEGVSTAAFVAMLQVAPQVAHHLLDVGDDEASPASVVQALRRANAIRPDVVVLLFEPGRFGEGLALRAGVPVNVSTAAATPDDGEPLASAFWRAALQNRVGLDFGFEAPHDTHHLEPGCPPHHRAGPGPGERALASFPGISTYHASVKPVDRLAPADLAHLDPVDASALARATPGLLARLCAAAEIDALVANDTLVVVPAGDDANHTRSGGTTSWDAQTLWPLAELPHVLTVGATVSEPASRGPPHYGTRRVVLNTSGAGPTHAHYGVKPDLVAPADVPTLVRLGGPTVPGYPVASNTFHERFDRQGAWVFGGNNGKPSIVDGRLSLASTNANYRSAVLDRLANRSDTTAALEITFDHAIPATGHNPIHIVSLSETTHSTVSPRSGWGFTLRVASSGTATLSAMVWDAQGTAVNCIDHPIEQQPICPTTPPLTTNGRLKVRVEPTGVGNQYRWSLFDLNDANRAPVSVTDGNTQGCACRHVILLSDPGANVPVYVDDLIVEGWPGTPVPMLNDTAQIPLAAAGFDVRTRPSTRVAAGYTAAHAALLSPGRTAQTVRLELMRSTHPLDDVPGLVQGVGELEIDPLPAGILRPYGTEATQPAQDLGIRDAGGHVRELIFNAEGRYFPAFTSPTGLYARAEWWRIAPDGTVSKLATPATCTSASAVPCLDDDPAGNLAHEVPTRRVNLTLVSLPAASGVYVGRVPFELATTEGIPHPATSLFAWANVTLVVTRGVVPDLDVASAGLAPGESVWLLPAAPGGGILHETLAGHPVWTGTVTPAGRIASADVLPPGDYALLAPSPAKLPIPTPAGSTPFHEGGRRLDLAVVSERVRIAAGGASLLALDPSASARATVAFRVLDVVDGAEFEALHVRAPSSVAQAFGAPAPAPAGAWDRRGEADARGRARDDPLPVGETPLAWEHATVRVLPGPGLGARSAAQAKADVLAAGDDGPHVLDGALDVRPFALEGGALPWTLLRASVPLPGPARDAHGVLAVPLELQEATAWVRASVAGQSVTYVVTPEGALVAESARGLAWGHAADPRDAIADATAGGLLSGHGHEHALGSAAELRLRGPDAEGRFLLPWSFHGLAGEEPAVVAIEVLVAPHPAPPTALARRPYDPDGGPRYRLAPVTLYAWTSGAAARGPDTIGPLALPPASRYQTAPGETIEAFVRGPVSGLSARPAGGGPAIPADLRVTLDAAPIVDDVDALWHAWALGAPEPAWILQTALHVYGPVPHAHPFAPVELGFAEPDRALWRLGTGFLHDAADEEGAVLVFAGPPFPAGSVSVADPFPDFADASRGGIPRLDVCLARDPGPVAVVGDALTPGCDGASALAAAALARAIAGAGFEPGEAAGVAVAALADGPAWLAAPADAAVPLATATIAEPAVVFAGIVPESGALLLARHAFPDPGAGVRVELTLDANGSARFPLPTIEGRTALVPEDPAVRGERLDLFDLDPYAGRFVTIRAEPSGVAWSADLQLAPRARPLPPAALSAPAFPLARPTDPPLLGPGEIANLPAGGAAALPRGLDVVANATLANVTLLLGATDASGAGAVVRVAAGATLTLEDAVLAPRSPRAAWGVHVEKGGALVVRRSHLLDGGAPATRGATILAEGAVTLVDATLAGGATGVLATGGIVASEGAFASFVRALDVRGGSAALRGALVSSNLQGVLVRDATLEVEDAVFAGNAIAALVAQDALVAVDGATFFGNGGAGARGALVALEGLDTGRVVLHDATFVGDARAIHARADVDAHASSVNDAGATALVASGGARIRLQNVDVEARAVGAHVGAGSSLVARSSRLVSVAWLDCAAAAPPALVEIVASVVEGALDPACGAVTPSGGSPASADPAWRALVARPFLRAEGNDARVLPLGASATLFEDDEGALLADRLVLEPVGLRVTGPDRHFRHVAWDGTPPADAWRSDAVRDATAPAPTLAVDAVFGPDAWTRNLTIPLRLSGGEAGSGVASYGVLLDTDLPDGRRGLRGVPAISGAREETLALGLGGRDRLALVTGERANLTPVATDRAGNSGVGLGRSVSLDLTPPSVRVHRAYPCGPLLGHDLAWRAHDPRAGSGLPEPPAVTYALSARAFDADAILGLVGLDEVDWRRLADPATAQEEADVTARRAAENAMRAAAGLVPQPDEVFAILEARDPQKAAALIVRALDAADAAVAAGENVSALALTEWTEIGRFPRDVEGIRFSLEGTLEDFLAANPFLGFAVGNATWTAKRAMEGDLEAIAAAALARAHAASPPNGSLLPPVGDTVAWLMGASEALAPLLLVYRLEAVDAVGNTRAAHVGAVSDAFPPQVLGALAGALDAGATAAALLAPGARVELAEPSASVRLLDPDCGLAFVNLTQRLLDGTDVPLVDLHPRDGHVEITTGQAVGLWGPDACGARTVHGRAVDRAGRESRFELGLLVDHVAPATTLLGHSREAPLGAGLPPLPPEVAAAFPPPALDDAWLAGGKLRVRASTASQNLATCPDEAAPVEEVVIEAREPGGVWTRLHREPHGGPRGTNRTVETEAVVSVHETRFAAPPATLDGRVVELRVRGVDQAGNVERDGAGFAVRVDRVAPACSVSPAPLTEGFLIPMEYEATDPNLGAAGEIRAVALFLRPQLGPGAPWHLVGALPANMSAAEVRLDRHSLPAWVDPVGLNAVSYACAAYDAAGNAAMGSPVDALLDLDAPTVSFPGLPSAFANGTFTLVWNVTLGKSPLANVTVLAGRVGEPVSIQETSAALDGTFVLDPAHLLAEDGVEWRITVEAFTTKNTVGNLTHVVRFDVFPPTLGLGPLADALLPSGFVPAEVGAFTATLADPGARPSPVTAWVVATDAAGESRRLDPEGLAFALALPDGAHTLAPRACDAAGNCMDAAPGLAILFDRSSPATTLLGSVTELPATIAAGRTIQWIDEATTFRFRVDDPVAGGVSSGADALEVVAQPLDPVGFAPMGDPQPLHVARDGDLFVASPPPGLLGSAALPSGRPFELRVAGLDAAGNREAFPHVPIPGATFAWDGEAPLVTLRALPDYVASLASDVVADVLDDGPGLDSGPVAFRLVTTREGVAQPGSWTALAGTVASASLDLALDEGRNVGVCVEARDAVGNVGVCVAPETILVDRTPPIVTLVPPLDAGPSDPTTRLAPVVVGVRVENVVASPGHLAAPVDRVILDATGYDHVALAAAPLAGIRVEPLGAAGALPPGGAATVSFVLPIAEYGRPTLRAGAFDAAGNAAPLGSVDPARPPRTTQEVLHASFEGGVATDLSLRRQPLLGGGVPAPGRFGGGWRLDQAPLLYDPPLSLGETDEVTAMAWIRLDAAPTGNGITRVLGYPEHFNWERRWETWLDASERLNARVEVQSGEILHLYDTATIPVGVWKHVAFAHGGGFSRLYVDGVEVAAAPFSGRFSINAFNRFHVGGGTGNLTIDEVRVHPAVLDAAAIRDLAARPHLAAGGAAPLVVHLDQTPPDATLHRPAAAVAEIYQAAASVGVQADDRSLFATGVASTRIEARALDGSAYSVGHVGRDGMATMPVIGEKPYGVVAQIARKLQIPPGTTSVVVEAVNRDDSDGSQGSCVTSIHDDLFFQLQLGTVVVAERDVADASTGLGTLASPATAVSAGITDLAFLLRAKTSWKDCAPDVRLDVDRVRVKDAATGAILFEDTFPAGLALARGWSVTGAVSTSAPWAADLGVLTRPNHAATRAWTPEGAVAWTLAEPDSEVSLSVVQGLLGEGALRVAFADTQPLADSRFVRAGETFAPVAGRWLQLEVKLDETPAGPGTILGRFGAETRLEGGARIVHLLREDALLPREAGVCFDATHLGSAKEFDWKRVEIDVEAAKAACGLSGRVEGFGLYVDKATSPNDAFEILAADVRLLVHRHLRVELPWGFPFAGALRTEVYASRNGAIGLTPTFDDTPGGSPAAPVILPAWGVHTDRGRYQGALHGVTVVSAADRDEATIVFQVADPADPAAKHLVFAATLRHTGEILYSYGRMDAPLTQHVGVAGVPGGVAVGFAGGLHHAPPLGIVPAGPAWSAVATTSGTSASLPPNVALHLRAIATDAAGNEEPTLDAAGRERPVELVAYVDTAPPVVSGVSWSLAGSALTLRATAVDVGVGLAPDGVVLRYNTGAGTAWQQAALPRGAIDTTLTLPAGAQGLEIRATDRLGHATTHVL